MGTMIKKILSWALFAFFLFFILDITFFKLFQKDIESKAESSQGRARVLSVGTNVWPGYQPFYLARAKGYYDDVPIKLNQLSSNTQIINAFKNGNLQAAALTLDEALSLKQYVPKLKLILILDFSNGGDAIVAQKGFPDFKSLKGKRIGLENTALGAYVLIRALSLNALSINDFQMVPLQLDQHKEAFLRKKVDAVITFEPVLSELEALGGNLVFDSTQIPREIVDVLVVHEDFVKKSPRLVQKLVDGWFKALSDMQENREESLRLMAQNIQVLPLELSKGFEGLSLPGQNENQVLLGSETSQFRVTIRQLDNIMRRKGLIKHSLSQDDFIENRFLQ